MSGPAPRFLFTLHLVRGAVLPRKPPSPGLRRTRHMLWVDTGGPTVVFDTDERHVRFIHAEVRAYLRAHVPALSPAGIQYTITYELLRDTAPGASVIATTSEDRPEE